MYKTIIKIKSILIKLNIKFINNAQQAKDANHHKNKRKVVLNTGFGMPNFNSCFIHK
jgi:hypothetical protein